MTAGVDAGSIRFLLDRGATVRVRVKGSVWTLRQNSDLGTHGHEDVLLPLIQMCADGSDLGDHGQDSSEGERGRGDECGLEGRAAANPTNHGPQPITC